MHKIILRKTIFCLFANIFQAIDVNQKALTIAIQIGNKVNTF